jgi:acyl carrier protein
MERDDIRAAVLAELTRIAPELAPDEVTSDKLLRDQVDLDSMDWLNFLVAVHERLSVEIPESDYGRLATLNEIVDYIALRASGAPGKSGVG